MRRLVWHLGFRYRLNVRTLPGSPDLVFRRQRRVIFVHGCFWHRHPGCRRATLPATRRQWWRNKLDRNVRRDQAKAAELERQGWSLMTVWECELREAAKLAGRLKRFLSR